MTDVKQFHTLNEVAQILGVSRNTILNWKNRPTNQNPLVFIKLGNHWRIKKEKLEQWIQKEQNKD